MSQAPTPRRQSSAPSTPFARSQFTSRPQQPTFPPAQTFDILAPLHDLIARIIDDDASISIPMQITSPNDPPQEVRQQKLKPQDLGKEVSTVKAKIRRARTVISAMPDIDRSVEEQELEITELRERITKQQDALKSLKAG